ncbi:MAG TPA: mannose-6-phosphate isomerase, class I [Thermoanaerobaculia bacterium]|nr:mannose-6-phosphate isomerase, class I [Thermoanaerobaculia bacterium]
MTTGPFLLPLRGSIKTYAWGSRTVLAGLTGRTAPAHEPEAELWIGAHERGASEIVSNGAWVSLRETIARDPVGLLGASEVGRFGSELPFLLKLLAIERPLSLQVHPDRTEAAAGYERERAAGIAPEDGSYRDARHKPELIVALEPVWALQGVLEPDAIRGRFAEAGVVSFGRETERLARQGAAGLRGFLGTLLGLAGEKRSRVLAEARFAGERARRKAATTRSAATPNEDSRDDPLFWLGRLLELHPEDPAALAPLFLHLVHLAPEQGLFQAPGVLHCYLEGAGVEVMASSDNVVRAGLTAKPIDLAEILAVADTTPVEPVTIRPREVSPGVARYPAAAEEFQLLRLEATSLRAMALVAPEALLLGICTRGEGHIAAPSRGEALALTSGRAFAVRPGAGTLRLDGDLRVYAATTAPTGG